MILEDKIKIYKQDWWATPIWFFDIEDELIDFKKIEKECYEEKEKDFLGRSVSNINGWQSNLVISDKYPEILKVIKNIANNAHIFIKDMGINKETKFFINDYWININNKNGYNIAHTHPQSLFSCIFYVKTPKNCGDVVFWKSQFLQIATSGYTDNNNSYNFECIKYEAKEKRVIVFPSHVLHSVEENKSDEDRISIAFNFCSKRV
jgi:uncharacterized protein (TIGR02466 family)